MLSYRAVELWMEFISNPVDHWAWGALEPWGPDSNRG